MLHRRRNEGRGVQRVVIQLIGTEHAAHVMPFDVVEGKPSGPVLQWVVTSALADRQIAEGTEDNGADQGKPMVEEVSI